MKKIILMCFAVASLSAVLISCKKETRIERNLWKNGGEWNIETNYYEIRAKLPDPDGLYYSDSETRHDDGTITFKKDGSGSYRLNDGDVYAFTYSNSAKLLTLRNTDGETNAYEITDWKKNKLTLTLNIDSSMFTSKRVLTLKKK